MHLDFDEVFPIAVEDAYARMRSPQRWPEVWGSFTKVVEHPDGFYRVSIRRTPFPLIVKVIADEPLEKVSWDLLGFWKGDGELRFEGSGTGTRISGHETINLPRLLRPLEGLLAGRFAAVWEGGWRRLRRRTDRA